MRFAVEDVLIRRVYIEADSLADAEARVGTNEFWDDSEMWDDASFVEDVQIVPLDTE